MARQRTTGVRPRRVPEVAEAVFLYMADAPKHIYEQAEGANKFLFLALDYPTSNETEWKRYCDLWRAVRDDILPEWVRERPGTRPRAWWLVDAPRAEVTDYRLGWRKGAYAETVPEPREEAGVGTVESEAAYLKRHGLLGSEEEDRLGPADFAPVVADTPHAVA